MRCSRAIHRTIGAAAVLACLVVTGCQPRQADPDPGAGDPPPAPVAARGDTLTNGAPTPRDTAALAPGGVRHPSDRQTGAGSGTPEIERLYREAFAIARAGGCSASGDCASMPVGAKPCGGPWEYVVYCRLTTDTTRLRAVLDELARRQREYNTANQVGSICDMILEPRITVRGNRCALSSP